MSLALSACGKPMPTGADAMREIVPAVFGDDASFVSQQAAVQFSTGTVDFASGFAEGDYIKNWTEDKITQKTITAFKPYRAKVDEAMYASLTQDYESSPERVTEMVKDVRDPARLKTIQCAYDKTTGTFAWDKCDTAVFGEEDYFYRYNGLNNRMRNALKTPVSAAAFGVAGCEVIDAFVAEAKTAQPDLELSGFAFTLDDEEKRDCPQFRELGEQHLKGAK
jgi:hypothetical protein